MPEEMRLEAGKSKSDLDPLRAFLEADSVNAVIRKNIGMSAPWVKFEELFRQ